MDTWNRLTVYIYYIYIYIYYIYKCIYNIYNHRNTKKSVLTSPRERGFGLVIVGKRGKNGNGKKLCLGQWVHNAVCRLCFVKMYI